MKILAINTCSTVGSVAISEGEDLIIEYSHVGSNRHSSWILPAIDSILKEAKIGITEIGFISLLVGPGPFTGVKVGVGTAKGLAQVLGIDIVPVNTLDAMAASCAGASGVICPVIDAKRGQVYAAFYERGDGRSSLPGTPLTRKTAYLVIEPRRLFDVIRGEVSFFGDGIKSYHTLFETEIGSGFHILPQFFWYPRGYIISYLGFHLFNLGKKVSPGELTPFYLRMPDAVRSGSCNKKDNRERHPFCG